MRKKNKVNVAAMTSQRHPSAEGDNRTSKMWNSPSLNGSVNASKSRGGKQLEGALWVIFKADRGKKWDDPEGIYWKLINGGGYIGKFDPAWSPFSKIQVPGYIPPPVLVDLNQVDRTTPERRVEIKAEFERRARGAETYCGQEI